MTAAILQFPQVGPFAVEIERDGQAWVVTCCDHGWLHGSDTDALEDARVIARGFAVAVRRLGVVMRNLTAKTNGGRTMDFDNTDRGVLFRDTRKQKDEDRDYSGSLNVAGTEYWVSAWLKKSKKGTPYLSLAVTPKEETPAKSTENSSEDDMIPF
jgi:hypothetical protein